MLGIDQSQEFKKQKPIKVLYWTKLFALTAGAQTLIQIVGFLSGIMIIRFLPLKEYAFYTIANTMLGTMVVLADSGIALGVMAQGGKIWQNIDKLGLVIVSGISLRRKFALLSLIVALPILFYLLVHQGASWLKAGLIACSLIPTFYAALSDSLLEIAPKLNQDINSLQRNQLSVSFFRLVLSLIFVAAFPFTQLIILATGLPRIWGNLKLNRISGKYANLNQKSDEEIQGDILKVVKRILPGSIYYCVSGQVTLWLLSIFGSVNSVAQIGGLSRLAALLTVFSLVTGILIEPRFARLPNNRNVVMKRFIQIQIVFITIGIFLAVLINISPDQFTYLLGKQYSGLHREVILVFGASYLSFLSGFLYKMSAGRGLIPSPAVFLTCVIVCQVFLFFVVDFKSAYGALLIGLFVSLFSYIFRIVYFLRWYFLQFNQYKN